jgi:hypothetical protein
VSSDPRQLLSGSQALARRVRAEQRAIWFPLLVFAAMTFGAIPFDRYGHLVLTCRAVPAAGPAGRVCTVYSSPAFVYWPVALVLAYVAIAAFSLHRARARGVGTRVLPYIVVGVVIAIVLTAASLWVAHHPSPTIFKPTSVYRLIAPAAAIGLALLVLAWVERSVALFVVTVGYLVIVLVPVNFGWVLRRPSPWYFLPHLVIYGSVLLLAGIGFALAERTPRPPPA